MEILNEQSERRSLANVKVGKDVKIFNFVNLYGCEIGDGSKVGTFVEIQRGAFIGKNCKISSHSFICEGVHLGNGVFIGHGVMFTNDLFPRAVRADGGMQTDDDWHMVETHIEDFVSIGSNATILCGIRIGKGALIGAGAMVTKDVPPFAVVVGNPGRVVRQLEPVELGF